MKFSDLNLVPALQASIDKAGFEECTPIQKDSMPHIVEGKDVAGLAQTGTGKTAAFLIPLMERILRAAPPAPDASDEEKALHEKRGFKDWRANNFILILVPTRELAEQVMENIDKFGEATGLRGVAVYGGTSYDKQREGFRKGVEFVAATPGRLMDLYKDNMVDLKQVRAIVFDEADRMFDMGFKDDMKFILQRIPRERQYLVFSATLNFDVLNTAYQFGSEPIEVNISRDQTKAENVKDEIFHVGNNDKPQHLLSLIRRHNPKQAIVFTNFKLNVDRIAKFLSDNGVKAMGISSLLSQAQRNRVMEAFKGENDMNVLVATDVAARGLDIKGVDLVLNYELPNDSESYVHRIGRTGRAGHVGTAYSLVSDRDVDSLMRIEEYLKHKLETGYIEDQDLVKEFKSFSHGEFNSGRMLNDAYNEGRPAGRDGGGRGGRREGRGGGPRSEGGRRDGRGGRNNDRRDRRPRPPGAEGEAQAASGSAPGAQTQGQPGGSGPRREGRHDQRRRPHSRSGNGEARSGQGPRPPRQEVKSTRRAKIQTPAAKPGANAPTLGKKVKAFFKRIFS